MYVIFKNFINLVVVDLIKEFWKIFKNKYKFYFNNVEDELMMNSEKELLSGSYLLNSFVQILCQIEMWIMCGYVLCFIVDWKLGSSCS